MSLLIRKSPPDFSGQAVQDGKVIDIQLSDFLGKTIVLLFYPLNFSELCAKELQSFNTRINDFAMRDAVVLACSVSTVDANLAWCRTPKKENGIQNVSYPVIADTDGSIAKSYGVYFEDYAMPMRGTFIIDRDFVVRAVQIYDNHLTRSVPNTLRLVDEVIQSRSFDDDGDDNSHIVDNYFNITNM